MHSRATDTPGLRKRLARETRAAFGAGVSFTLTLVAIAGIAILVFADMARGADLLEVEPPRPHGLKSWSAAKRLVGEIYADHRVTLYCGCAYSSDGIVDVASCGLDRFESKRAKRMEVEHIVPASILAGDLPCWEEGGRKKCERADAGAKAMIFEPRNLAPSSGYVNMRRSNDRYADLARDSARFGTCAARDRKGAFEPPDCAKGDVARVWFYMARAHGVQLSEGEWIMLGHWAEADPVSPWEAERERRIAARVGGDNPYVDFIKPDPAGACPWE